MRLLALALICAVGCANSPPTTRPVSALAVHFQSPSDHVQFTYPASWHAVKDDTILTLVPTGESALGLHTLVIDNPDLPLHIPFLIPLDLVVRGFVNDVKTRYKDVTVDPPVDRTLADAKGRQIRATGTRAAGAVIVTAVLCVHGDAVYLIDAETDPAGAPAAKAAMEQVIESFQWMD